MFAGGRRKKKRNLAWESYGDVAWRGVCHVELADQVKPCDGGVGERGGGSGGRASEEQAGGGCPALVVGVAPSRLPRGWLNGRLVGQEPRRSFSLSLLSVVGVLGAEACAGRRRIALWLSAGTRLDRHHGGERGLLVPASCEENQQPRATDEEGCLGQRPVWRAASADVLAASETRDGGPM